jgi:alpha-L-rhamnosidase
MSEALRISRLTVEHTAEPVGVDVVPRFGWTVESDTPGTVQEAYRLRVADGDSGWQDTPAHSEIPYDGPALRPLTRYDWSVEVRTSAGEARADSHFVTGITDGDWHGAEWIGHPDPDGAAPLLRRTVTLGARPAQALVVIAAGGYARTEIDGIELPGTLLEPGFTDYDARYQYTVHDVTDRLDAGDHVIGFELGRGFYGKRDETVWSWHVAPWHDEPCVRALLVVDGVAVAATDDSWLAIDGPTRYDDVYGGETFDAEHDREGWSSVGTDTTRWAPASLRPGPRGVAVHQRQQPIGVIERLRPATTTTLGDGRWLVTFPRMIAGGVEVTVTTPGEYGFRYGEKLHPDGEPDYHDVGPHYEGRFQQDVLIVPDGAAPLTWSPRFTYKGFQHVEVTGPELPDLEAFVLHSRVPVTSEFTCSDADLTRLHELTLLTVLNNLHGIPTDTPAYEKNGWTGDASVGTELMLANLDIHEFLAKWVTDVADSRHGSGAPAVIAPDPHWSSGADDSPVWHSALVLTPWWIYEATGDVRVLRDVWPDATAYLRFELDRAVDGITDTMLGDWCSPDQFGGGAPEDRRVSGTGIVIAMLDAVASMARVLGEPVEEWEQAAAAARAAFIREFYDPALGYVRGNHLDSGYRQTHNVVALAFDILPEDLRQGVADSIAANVRERGDHLSTGLVGTKWILPMLTRYGHGDVALAVAQQRSYPSWGYWLSLGATTLWEEFRDTARSYNHYFLGVVDDWLFRSVAGLGRTEPGWRRAIVDPDPAVLRSLDHARVAVRTPHGRLAVAWKRDGTEVVYDIEVPVGLTVDVAPSGETLTSGRHRIVTPTP